VGVETNIVLQVLDENGDIVSDVDTVTGELLDSEGEVLQDDIEFDEIGDDWEIVDEILWWPGTLVITAVNDTGETEHDGNITFEVDMATISYSPDTITCGIQLEDAEITVTGTDAFGDPLTEVELFLNPFNASDGTDTDITIDEVSITIDEDGTATFTVEDTGNRAGKVNGTFIDEYCEDWGNNTYGQLTVAYPDFEISPSTISSELNSAEITVTATDGEGNKIAGLNLTFTALAGRCIEPPDPVTTDENGVARFTIAPLSSGKANVTILHGLEWDDDWQDWTADDTVITDSVLTITHLTMDVTLSATKVYAGDEFTVTVDDDGTPVADADVTFDGTTTSTDANGVATFTADSPGVDSYQYTITVEKTGYPDVTATILVLNTYQITISGPSSKGKGETFTVTVIANTKALAGATVTFNDNVVTSDNDGKASFKAPDKKRNIYNNCNL
jgi:hypothetical protein